MTVVEEIMQTALAAGEDQKRDALRVLRGEAAVADGSAPRPVTGPLLMGMGEAAQFLGISRPTLWRMIQAGRVEKVELFPGSNRLRRLDLEELAMRRKEKK
jgi:excisionase family DNA binding protein